LLSALTTVQRHGGAEDMTNVIETLTPIKRHDDDHVTQRHPIVKEWPAFTLAERDAMSVSLLDQGLLMPITIWRDQIVDGHHRETLCRELRVLPRYNDITKKCPDEASMRRYVEGLNSHRRSRTAPLTNAEKQARIDEELEADPARSNRAIAEITETDHKTVGKVRVRKERVGKSPPPAERKSRTGKVGEGARKSAPAKPTKRVEPKVVSPPVEPSVHKYSAAIGSEIKAAGSSLSLAEWMQLKDLLVERINNITIDKIAQDEQDAKARAELKEQALASSRRMTALMREKTAQLATPSKLRWDKAGDDDPPSYEALTAEGHTYWVSPSYDPDSNHEFVGYRTRYYPDSAYREIELGDRLATAEIAKEIAQRHHDKKAEAANGASSR
jgi:hypothetical protein